MNSKNSKKWFKLSGKINLKRSDKFVALWSLSLYYTWKYMKIPYKNSKFKILAPIWSEEVELPDGSYSVSDVKGCFEYILKVILQWKHT